MNRNYLILVVGLVIVLVPFSGFPKVWDTAITIISGLILVLFSISAYLRHRIENFYLSNKEANNFKDIAKTEVKESIETPITTSQDKTGI